jgi:hypothetical protein
MAIEAAPIVPQKQLLDIDPDGESWVLVVPATPVMNLQRGELLKMQEFDSSGYFTRVIVNPVLLQNKEVWLSFPGRDPKFVDEPAHIVIVDETAKDGKRVLFSKPPKDGWSESAFYEILEDLDPAIIASWVAAVRRVNRGWVFPFA